MKFSSVVQFGCLLKLVKFSLVVQLLSAVQFGCEVVKFSSVVKFGCAVVKFSSVVQL